MRMRLRQRNWIPVLTVLLLSASSALGEPRNLLTGRYSPDDLAQSLISLEKFRPYPVAGDEAWAEVPLAVRTAHIETAERFLTLDWPSLPATVFLEFFRIGNRSRYESMVFERRNRLADLVLAEIFENRGRFLDQIATGVWLTCEESYWGVPAHLNLQKAGSGLPDVSEPTVDLFAAETAGLLAWTQYLLGDRLESISPLINQRIRLEIERRILEPNFRRDDFWWMGFAARRRVNNWNPWINSNWLTAALLNDAQPRRRTESIYKMMRSLDRFLNDYPADGGCDEGPGYWGRAGASLFECLEWLHLATSGRIDIFDEPLIRAIGQYIYRAYIGEGYFVNYADATARPKPDPSIVFRYGRATKEPRLIGFGAFLAKKENLGRGYLPGSFGGLGRRVSTILSLSELQQTAPLEPLVQDVWLPGLEFMAARDKEGSVSGFYVSAKGGHNAESHNHNDVGNFIVYYNGFPVIVDAGVGTYTKKTFSSERYSIWTMQSAYHNLPTPNGVMQEAGRAFRARNVECSTDAAQSSLNLDISAAYPPKAGLESWERSIVLKRGTGIEVRDHFRFTERTAKTYWTLLTPCRFELSGEGRLTLRTANQERVEVEFDPLKLSVRSEAIPISDSRLTRVWGDQLVRLVFDLRSDSLEDQVSFRFAGFE